MFVPLDRDSPVALARQIATYLEGLVRHGHLGPGARLPATRTLATGLGVNKKTVEAAYDELAGRGLVKVVPGRGASVRRAPAPAPELDLPFRAPRGRDPLPLSAWLTPDPPMERPLDLAGAGPRLSAVASRQLRLFHEEALGDSPGPLFAPPPPLGEATLRAAAGRHLARCGVLRPEDEVAVRSSRAAAVADVAALFVPRRGLVLLDALLDPDLVRPMLDRGARLRVLPAGADADALASAVRRASPRLLVVATGTSRVPGPAPDPVRRRALLYLARELGLPVLEDVTGTDRLERPPIPPPLAALDATGRVLAVCDLSDEAGGRLGGAALAASPKALERIRLRSGAEDAAPDRLAQRALARALDAASRPRSLRAVRERRALVKTAVARGLRRRLAACGPPLFSAQADAVRLDLPADVDPAALAARAEEHGVLVNTGRDCGAPRGADRFLLLDLTRHEEGELLEGIRRLGEAFDGLEGEEDRTAGEPPPKPDATDD